MDETTNVMDPELAAIQARQMVIYKRVIVIAALLIIAVVGQALLLPIIGFGQERYMRMMPTDVFLTYNFDSGAVFYSNDSRDFFFVTRDGVRRILHNGEVDWNHTQRFTRPVINGRGDFFAVGEVDRGRNISVFNTSGHVFTSTFENPVLSFNINDTGFLTAIVRAPAAYEIFVLNNAAHDATEMGSVLYMRVVGEQGLHFPTFAEVSPDGRFLVTATVDLTYHLSTILEFRFVNEADSWDFAQGLFGATTFNGELVTSMRFMSNNRLIVTTTSRIICFQIGPNHAEWNEVWSIRLENELSHVGFYSNTHIIFVTGDRLLGLESGDPVGTVRIFNVNGVESGSFSLGRRVTHLSVGNNAVIIGSDRNFHALDIRGNPMWEHTLHQDSRDFMFLEDTNTVLVVGSTRADIMRRRRLRNDEIENLPPIGIFQ